MILTRLELLSSLGLITPCGLLDYIERNLREVSSLAFALFLRLRFSHVPILPRTGRLQNSKFKLTHYPQRDVLARDLDTEQKQLAQERSKKIAQEIELWRSVLANDAKTKDTQR